MPMNKTTAMMPQARPTAEASLRAKTENGASFCLYPSYFGKSFIAVTTWETELFRPACATSCLPRQGESLLPQSSREHTPQARQSDRVPGPEAFCRVAVPFSLRRATREGYR